MAISTQVSELQRRHEFEMRRQFEELHSPFGSFNRLSRDWRECDPYMPPNTENAVEQQEDKTKSILLLIEEEQ